MWFPLTTAICLALMVYGAWKLYQAWDKWREAATNFARQTRLGARSSRREVAEQQENLLVRLTLPWFIPLAMGTSVLLTILLLR